MNNQDQTAYTAPELEVVRLAAPDVICASDLTRGDNLTSWPSA